MDGTNNNFQLKKISKCCFMRSISSFLLRLPSINATAVP